MPDARKRPCCVCRRWFRPDPRIGMRQRACSGAECQAVRRVQTQKSWRDRNPDYFMARRMQERGNQEQPPEPLRLPPPLSQLPWDIAQDQFGVKGPDSIGVVATTGQRAAQAQLRAHSLDSTAVRAALRPIAAKPQPRPLREWVRAGKPGHEAGVSSTGPPL